jgi:hypothetical protein
MLPILPDLKNLSGFLALPTMRRLPVYLTSNYGCILLAISPSQVDNIPVSIVQTPIIKCFPQSDHALTQRLLVKNLVQNP